jgi:hypothetical protein
VTAVRVVEVIADQVVGVIAVRHRFVPAAAPVPVIAGVIAAGVRRRAGVGVLGADVDRALVDVIAMRVVEMALVDIVGMVAVLDRGVTTAGTVLVLMPVVLAMLCHGEALRSSPYTPARGLGLRAPPGEEAASTSTRSGKSSSGGTRYGMPATRILWGPGRGTRARLPRW